MVLFVLSLIMGCAGGTPSTACGLRQMLKRAEVHVENSREIDDVVRFCSRILQLVVVTQCSRAARAEHFLAMRRRRHPYARWHT